jgi:ketosteroid isomerase-like protein
VAFTGSVADRLKIRERLDTYSDAVARRDVDAYLSCWTEDGRRSGSGGECSGKPALRAHWDGIWQVLEKMAFLTQVAAIEVAGNRATARSYSLEILHPRGGDVRRLVGMYEDELVRDGDDWVFASRRYQVLMGSG